MFFKKSLERFGRVRINESLAKHTTFKIGGPAAYFLTITETPLLVEALRFLDGEGISYRIVGGGSNMLASDEGFSSVIVHVQTGGMRREDNFFIAEAGCFTVQVAEESMKQGLLGFAWGVGVPGTIGGAVRGNAGAMGKEMKDDVKSVTVYGGGEVYDVTASECGFSYRESRFKTSGEVVLSVRLHLQPETSLEEKANSRKNMLSFLSYRNKTQPKGFASTGCIFKNPSFVEYGSLIEKMAKEAYPEQLAQFARVGRISAGWLVEYAGMKGARVGGAVVSPVHGNFVVSDKNATATDVRALIEKVQEAVQTKTGIVLHEEIQYLP